MNQSNLIRLLIGLNMVLFMLPFFNACSNQPVKEKNKTIVNTIRENDLDRQHRRDLLKMEKTRFEAEKWTNNEMNQNAYQLAITPFKDVNRKNLGESYFYFCLCFTFIIVFNIIMLIFSLSGKMSRVKFFNFLNLAILLTSLVIISSSGILEHADQIKIGFYLYLLNLIVLTWLLFRNKDEVREN